MKNTRFISLQVVGTVLLGLVSLSTFAGYFPAVMVPTPGGVYLYTSTKPVGAPTGGWTGNPAVQFKIGVNYLYIVNGNKQPNPADLSTFMCRVKLDAVFPKGCEGGATKYNQGGPTSSSKHACGVDGAGSGHYMGLRVV